MSAWGSELLKSDFSRLKSGVPNENPKFSPIAIFLALRHFQLSKAYASLQTGALSLIFATKTKTNEKKRKQRKFRPKSTRI